MNDLEVATGCVIAVLPERRECRRVEKSPPETKREPNYHVVIWNDEEHTHEYVIEMLMRIFSHSAAKAYDVTWQIDKLGKGIGCTCHRELAELKIQQIAAYGPDHSIADARPVSMRATLEPAAE